MITDIKGIDVKLLSRVYDRGSRDSFVSLYISFDRNYMDFIRKRVNACKLVLKNDKVLLENLEKSMEDVYRFLKDREIGQKGAVVFASSLNGFFKGYRVYPGVENLFVVDTSPYIRPVVELLDDYETFGLVVLDNHRARIYVVSADRVERGKKISEDVLNKHRKGGWSQARFQRIRKGEIKHFLKEVSQYVSKIFSEDNIEKIVVAGPGGAKNWLMDYLPEDTRRKVVDLLDVDFDDVDAVSDAEGVVAREDEMEKIQEVARLKGEILRGGLAVYGLNDVIDAVRNGKMELLLVNRGLKVKGWICEKCQVIKPGFMVKCPYCGSRTSEVDVVEEIIEFAERTDARVEFLDDNEILKELGGVGGLLRFK